MLRSLAAGRGQRAWIVTWHAAAGVNHAKLDTTGHWTLQSSSEGDSHAQATPELQLCFICIAHFHQEIFVGPSFLKIVLTSLFAPISHHIVLFCAADTVMLMLLIKH